MSSCECRWVKWSRRSGFRSNDGEWYIKIDTGWAIRFPPRDSRSSLCIDQPRRHSLLAILETPFTPQSGFDVSM